MHTAGFGTVAICRRSQARRVLMQCQPYSSILQRPTLVAVLAGHLTGALPAYQEATTRLGALLAGQGMALLLPGTSGGLLRAVAAGASTRGGQIIEMVVRGAPAPWAASDHVQRFEAADLHPRYEVANLYQRQALLLDQADAVIALPGGPATLWDLLGVVTLAH